MNNSKLTKVFLSFLIIIVLIGVIITLCVSTANKKNIIYVNIQEGSQTIEFKDGFLIPGEKCEYIISLEGDLDKYQLSLQFLENEVYKLKDCIWVSIQAEKKEIYTNMLASFFERDIVLPESFSKKKNEVKITYYLPERVVNETENADATFDLVITAKEWGKQ